MDGLIAYALAKKFAADYADEVGRRVEQAGFKVQIESDRSILDGVGQPKIMYFLPKEDPQQGDGYDEFIYTNDAWEKVGTTDVDLSDYATKEYLAQQIESAQEIYVGEGTPTGEEVVWIDTASQPTPPEPPVPTETVFGVAWDYSLSSPQLARLTSQTDPLGVVTTVPSQEPTACIGNDGNGQSEFDNFMPWKGMRRVNYVNGQVVDFVSYNNGETFVYIPEFWSKIVDDSANNKMYFYISSGELTGFTKHLGSDRYVGRYKCDGGLKSRPGGLSVLQTMHNFRINLKTTDANYYLYDIHSYNALQLLYLVEFSNFNIRSKIGVGITSGSSQNNGGTDTLIYHTGRVSGTENVSAVQYRWIENLYGNVWEFIDGVIINSKLVYICSDPSKYGDTVTNDYTSTGLYLPEEIDFVKKLHGYGNCYLFPKEHGGSESTYVCAKGGTIASENNALRTGGSFDSGETFGSSLFTSTHDSFTWSAANRGARQILILGGDS